MEPNIPRKQRDSPICKICSTSLLLGLLIYSTEIPHANPLQISLSTYCIAFINSNIFVYDVSGRSTCQHTNNTCAFVQY